MRRWMAAIVAILTVILSSFSGMIVGAFVGASIAPADLFDPTGDHGFLLVGAILGLVVGFYLGIWAAMGILDRAAAKRRRPRDPSTQIAGWLEHRSR
jgi:uncharacterized protein YneF (UPF0154 family)